ncbi:hypothetical protein GIB67_025927, partial [Kingdonia uniflora]
GKSDVSLNAKLSDICPGTSAAPTYLPAHYFQTKDSEGNIRTFDLIDKGVAVNNPDVTLMGIAASTNISTKENMENLVKIGENLLKKPVSTMNFATSRHKEVKGEGTNEEALSRFAKLLSNERKLREANVAACSQNF